MTFKCEGDDLLLDNANVFTPGVGWKYFGITVDLALNMGWLTNHPTSYSHPSYFPNMLMEFIDKTGPKADYTQESFHSGSVFEEYPNTFTHGPVTAVTEGQGWSVAYQGAQFMVLSNAYNWRFIRINEVFENFEKAKGAQTVERPLFIYVNLVESQWLEDSYDELLRTVPHKSREAWWEPRQVQYHRLRGSTIETAHVRVAEVNGRPVNFPTDETTTICLHFHRRCRRHGSCHFTQRCLGCEI